FLYFRKYAFTFILLGLGLAMKTHLLIVIPFLFIYLYKQKNSVLKLLGLSFSSVIVFILLDVPFFSKAFVNSVFNNPEQQRLFFFAFPYQYNRLALLVAPAILFLIFYRFASFKRMNYDSIVLILGLAYTTLIALVPPMQGWF